MSQICLVFILPGPQGLSGLDNVELKPREQPLSGLGLSCCPGVAEGHTSFTWNSLTQRDRLSLIWSLQLQIYSVSLPKEELCSNREETLKWTQDTQTTREDKEPDLSLTWAWPDLTSACETCCIMIVDIRRSYLPPRLVLSSHWSGNRTGSSLFRVWVDSWMKSGLWLLFASSSACRNKNTTFDIWRQLSSLKCFNPQINRLIPRFLTC